MNCTGRTAKSKWLYVSCVELAVLSKTEKFRIYAFDRSHITEQIIVSVQKNRTTGLHILDHLRFFLKNPFSCFEKFQMCDTDIRDHTDIRACYTGKTAHLTKVVDTHFQNSNLMLFIHFKNCNWKPPFIVEVSKCFMYTVFLRQYRSNHFLCTCLSDTSCDSDNLNIERITIKLCSIKKCLTSRLYQDIWKICLAKIFMGNHAHCAFFNGIRNEFVSVDAFTVNGNEQIVFFNFPAVNCNTGNFFVQKIFRSPVFSVAGLGNIS